jgi:glucose-6-phosphate 1-dehydrogenase
MADSKKRASAAHIRRGDECVMVIFGATGDLTKRLLMPAIYNLAKAKLLPEKFALMGFSNIDESSDSYRDQITNELGQYATTKVDPKVWAGVAKNIQYMAGDFKDPAAFTRLKETLAKIDQEVGTPGNYLFYLATSPMFFGEIVKQLDHAGLTKEPQNQWRRVIIEKPFGRDLESAKALNREIATHLEESQIFRIDHYLGKETVQNLMVFRFGNGIFEPIWNRRYIESVQVTAAETVGVELRGGYYDTAGALRDMVPNHMLTLLSMTAMEPPISFDSEAVRDEKAKVMHAIRPPSKDDVARDAVRGQYAAGNVLGKPRAAYRAEPNVDHNSNTETYAAVRLFIDNWRWADVPFYLRTGKSMAKRVTEIAIQFRRPPFLMFKETSVESMVPNILVIHVEPDQGISLRFSAKIPGPVVSLGNVDMAFKYSEYFRATPATGYETLLWDCMLGDTTLFQRADMVDAGWRAIEPVLEVWGEQKATDFPNYMAGSWGPAAADELLHRDGNSWRKIE